jgi:hypothetical protein
LPKTPIICKPSEFAIELALKIANINPQKTVSKITKIDWQFKYHTVVAVGQSELLEKKLYS